MKKIFSVFFVCFFCVFTMCSCASSRADDDIYAYEKAVLMGYGGTCEEFAAALIGENVDGERNAYETVSENGFNGSYEEWLSVLNIKNEKG